MPNCKKCHARLSRLDKDICPFCGAIKPLEGQDDSTEDITKAFDPLEIEDNKIKPKSKTITIILMMTLGIFGVHAFYLKRWKLGLIILGITIALIAGLGSILFFSGALHNVFAFLIPYFVLEAAMIVGGIIALKRNDIKDGDGEFIR
ncbi:MAG TPA: hypothetical protein DDW20_02920 [Firmicutes bacterium]|nr:hypothetical protein [Bacillota bacterium]